RRLYGLRKRFRRQPGAGGVADDDDPQPRRIQLIKAMLYVKFSLEFSHGPLRLRLRPAIRHTGVGSALARPSWLARKRGAIARAPGPAPTGGRSRARPCWSMPGTPYTPPA